MRIRKMRWLCTPDTKPPESDLALWSFLSPSELNGGIGPVKSPNVHRVTQTDSMQQIERVRGVINEENFAVQRPQPKESTCSRR